MSDDKLVADAEQIPGGHLLALGPYRLPEMLLRTRTMPIGPLGVEERHCKHVALRGRRTLVGDLNFGNNNTVVFSGLSTSTPSEIDRESSRSVPRYPCITV